MLLFFPYTGSLSPRKWCAGRGREGCSEKEKIASFKNKYKTSIVDLGLNYPKGPNFRKFCQGSVSSKWIR